MKIIISPHSRERYIARTKREFIHLRRCKGDYTTCRECDRVHRELVLYIKDNKKVIDQEIKANLLIADEEKHLKNDNKFMERWYNEHGYDVVPHILIDNDAVYILARKKNDIYVLLTVVDAQTHFAARRRRSKLNTKKQ